MGADWRHGPLPDCIYRRDPKTGEPLYPDGAAIFAAVHPAEDGLRRELAHWLTQLPPAQEWFVPLTVGAHVDHQLTRQAAEMATAVPLTYYEDYPYAQKPGAAALTLGGEEGWEMITVPLSATAVQIRYEAAALFASQFSSFFADRADMERQIGGHIAATGGERLWRRRKS
jgi:hypothetical protein